MFPVLFSIGSFDFKTITIFVLLSLFFSSFIFWRKGREEHYSQADIFDGFVLATLIGSVVARGIFILFNISNIGFNIIKWFDISKYPGFNIIAGLAAAAFFFHLRAQFPYPNEESSHKDSAFQWLVEYRLLGVVFY